MTRGSLEISLKSRVSHEISAEELQDNESIAPPLQEQSKSKISVVSISTKSSISKKSNRPIAPSNNYQPVINQPKSQENLPEHRNQFEIR